MADLVVQTISLDGDPLTYTAANLENTFTNNGDSFIRVKNDGTLSTTVTVDAKKTCSHGFLHSVSVSVPAGEERLIGVLPMDRFNDENRKANFRCLPSTNVSIAVVKL